MWVYLVRRVLQAGLVFVAVTLVTFVVFFVIPTRGPTSIEGRVTRSEDVARAVREMGLDRPVVVKYGL